MKFNKGALMDKPASSKTNKTGSWRTKKPVIDQTKCTRCGICWMFCPDGAIQKTKTGSFEPDLDYCKGCGICAEECPFKAITMVEEEK